MTSIKDLVKKRVMGDMVQSVNPPGGYKIVVIDPHTLKILNTAVKMHELLDENVTRNYLPLPSIQIVVEDLNSKRQSYPNKEAIYFISPTEACVDKLIDDFAKVKPMYAAAHVFFASALSDALFDKIKAATVSQYLRTLKEMNVDFIGMKARCVAVRLMQAPHLTLHPITAIESNVFSMEQPRSLFPLYNPVSSAAQTFELEKIAKRIISTLATLGEYPHIRYFEPTSGRSNLCSRLAHQVQSELDALSRMDTDFPPQTPFKRAILIIVDRTMDMVSPLVHEFTYQAMMNDLLVMEGGKVIYKQEGGASTDSNAAQVSSANLDENDAIWNLIKHWHFAEAVEYVRDTFNKFLSENKAAAAALGQPEGSEGAPSGGIDALKAMKDTLGALPQFQDMKSKFSVHINICAECQTTFARRRLEQVASVEQNLATGELADGRPTKNVVPDMVPLLTDEDVSPLDKVRMLMLYIITLNGIQDTERRRLLEHAKLSLEEIQAITNLSLMGVRLSVNLEKKGERDERGPYAYKTHAKKRAKKKGGPDDENPYDLSRWVPVMKTIMQEQARNTLDTQIFPWITEPPASEVGGLAPAPAAIRQTTARAAANALQPPDPNYPNSLRTTRPSWATKRPVGKKEDDAAGGSGEKEKKEEASGDLRKNGPRIILFVLGGVTFSEMRSAYEVMRETGREVIIGGTHILNPTQLLETLKELHKTEAAVTSLLPSTPATATIPSLGRPSVAGGGAATPVVAEESKKKKLGMFKKK
ncbi:vacuolar sorting protein VPS33/slp1 [Rhizophlyctis rosea]|nr:vacuolar sorting protein VPS33/slp1 [Rhizophlyctis rosea]